MGRSHDFFRTGVQYYAHGREALLCGHEVVAGSLFHQGFELIMKAALLERLEAQHSPSWAPTVPDKQRRAAVVAYSEMVDKYFRRLSHNLQAIWNDFKPLYPGTQLGGSDPSVSDLDRWWNIRYPGFPAGLGLQITTSIEEHAAPIPGQPQATDNYNLCLETMDRLFAAIAPLDWTLNAIRMALGGRKLTGRGVEMYEERNRHKLW